MRKNCVPSGCVTTATKASKARALPKFWVSICSHKKQQKFGVEYVLGLVKFAVAALISDIRNSNESFF